MDSSLYLGLGYLAAGFGAAVCLLAAALGISKLASAALEGTARQPEAAGNLRTSMIIPAALIEGLGFFALVICLLLALKAPAVSTNAAGAAPAASQSH
ncbi:MAG: ATP synthase F0 subunit C [Elusimicrobiota bacterium]